MKKAVVALLLLVTGAAALAKNSVIGSKHDFTSSPLAGDTAKEGACAFCHTSHFSGKDAPLSSRPDSHERHRPYQSRSMKQRAGSPSGSSRVCLSCHDGTVAVGTTRRHGGKARGAPIPASSRSHLGTDLGSSHPMSVRPSAEGRTHAPGGGAGVKLSASEGVQCTSCHDPHVEFGDPVLGKFLAQSSARGALCLACHEGAAFQPVAGAHASAAATLPAATAGTAGASTVGDAGCAACHAAHRAEPGSLLVIRGTPGDDDSACLRCHGTGVARAQVGRDAGKQFAHVAPGRHDAAEGPDATSSTRLPENFAGSPRHVTCVDCHNPHAATSTKASPGIVSGALAGVWGIDLAGRKVDPIRSEYELCFKCHGDSANKPQASRPLFPETIRRPVVDANLRLVFSSSAPSNHPVTRPPASADVPSLLPPWRDAGLPITCSDCHGSESRDVRGPHGSIFPHILSARYETADFTPESPGAYALCYGCHDRAVLLGEGATPSAFPPHRQHLVNASVPCSACHAAHGVSSMAGDSLRNTHLIAFDTTIAKVAPGGRREFQDGGSRHGSCYLSCHSRVHDGASLDPKTRGTY